MIKLMELLLAIYLTQVVITVMRLAFGTISSIYSFYTMLIPLYGFKEIFKF